MKYVKILLFALFFVVSMIFFAQNTTTLSQVLELKFEFFDYRWTSAPMPFYLFFLLGFFIGVVLPVLYFMLDKLRCAAALRDAHKKIDSLEQELAGLRNLPLTESAYSAPSMTTTASASEPEEGVQG